MIDYTMKIYGIEQIQAMFGRLPDRIATKVLRKGVAEAGRDVKKELKTAAPVRRSSEWKKYSKGARYRGPGFLRRHISSRYMRRKSRKHEKHYGIGPRGYAFYGYIVERGTKHAAPKPWIMPTFERVSPRVVRNMRDYFDTAIMKEGRRLGFIAKKWNKPLPFSSA